MTSALVLLCSSWGLVTGTGLGLLGWHAATPAVGYAIAKPVGAAKSKCPRLVMGVHPRCPCTQASVTELERLLTRVGSEVECTVYVYCPADRPTFSHTPLVSRLQSIAGVELVADLGGQNALEHGIEASGECVLYDALGKPRFEGGITHSRGHEGDSVGRQAIMQIVAGQEPVATSTPVFGCEIVRRGS